MELGALRVVGRTQHAAAAGELHAHRRAQALAPLAAQARVGEVARRVAAAAVVEALAGQRRRALRAREVAVGAAFVVEQVRRQQQAVAAFGEAPLQARRQRDGGALVHRVQRAGRLLDERAVVAPRQQRFALAVGDAVGAEEAERDVVDEVVDAVVARPVQARRDGAVLEAGADAQVVQPPPEAFAQDDVDGAGDGAGAGLGRGRAQDLDALDLLGRQRVEAEARRQPLAVDEQLRVAAAQAAQPRRAAAPRRAGRGDAGQAAQHLGDAGVAELVDLLAADDDARGGAAPARFDVGIAAAADLDARAARRRSRGRRAGGAGWRRGCSGRR
ncbi:MAG: hypothetical protein U1F67_12195 [Rubrivivax sp.]